MTAHGGGEPAQDRGLLGRMQRLFGRARETHRPPRLSEVTLQVVAHVANGVQEPRPRGWEKVESRIVFPWETMARLAGIDRFSHVIVTFVMDLAADAPIHPDTITLESGNTYGIYATRSQLRPNHLGVSVVPLLRAEDNVLHVRGLDAIDGTPVLDIKPYLPEYDAHAGASIPSARS